MPTLASSGLVLVSEGAINESCFFNEQCEHVNYQTECRDGRCMCRYELTPVTKQDGTVDCIVSKQTRSHEMTPVTKQDGTVDCIGEYTDPVARFYSRTIVSVSNQIQSNERMSVTKQNGSVDSPQTDHGPPQYVDPAMIGVLVGMALMFIIICVVLRLFSK
uniref:EB domain-containing protein n=1 Tax=Timema poppense TaxID=170557 RepID=A0A7R9CQ32_TIMPO|nr:unnamed protein product [Timema poppensis]